MLDLKFVQNNLDVVRESLEKRGSKLDVNEFSDLDSRRKSLLQEVESLKAERNSTSGEIAKIKREGGDASEIIARMGEVSGKIKALDEDLKDIEAAEREWLSSVPNMPDESVPFGKTEDDNPVIRHWGEKPEFDFTPREHWDLAVELGGVDFERAAKLTGARFVVLKKWGARLERALTSFMVDVQTMDHGYTEVIPPYIVNRDSLFGTGQLPKFEEDLFKLKNWEYYMIPTAEVPLTNLHRDEVLSEDDLSIAYCAPTPCFRSEAGSYGKDTKGLIRQHQFHKVEMVRFAHPDKSFEDLEKMTGHAEEILKRLGLHYRVITLCTGDMGFGSAKTYDIEVWLPGQDKYREISSCSNCVDFQARRANIKFQPKDSKKKQFVHTLNGSGLAVGRTFVAVVENYQQKDGSIVIPEALRPYMGGLEVITAE
ncbi:serine--tRNA ligase [Maridesulfovibrio salexigens]|uniref:Serine--tRNA ligase n=1 Tax=Maridesulfovibrio salexigens (strain ATCC 14822 / DSM 2638 / NCIMB 8403 / VKM B-1763) TaxID=526222 RepID=SYS_MARSD|nr:serine--tRNA ligase [Maridesulfovibrio salexigens]C6BS43.1 RecName: Full=Serine--tRNA ligase; AltName: Full=Seryl-tRNA synthetase; Short=SerRS; AltName: Full=Seryl-tRNA(Ser/Sec) synthetase [Maridesulfovibrio salexigens DSM 2638]ACS81426.1 seryl-tRNA synthetase [Maridesulfovibrio salexigens DSM 2638]